MTSNMVNQAKQVYIGETTRTLRIRAREHMNNVKYLRRDSFILNHWFEQHKNLASAPTFTFKQIRKFKQKTCQRIKNAFSAIFVDIGDSLRVICTVIIQHIIIKKI